MAVLAIGDDAQIKTGPAVLPQIFLFFSRVEIIDDSTPFLPQRRGQGRIFINHTLRLPATGNS